MGVDARMSLAETTAWCDERIWNSMPDREDVYAHIISAYHLRQDDAYAAVGMVRGQYKRQMPEYANDDWCEPVADFNRFILRGSSRGVLPSWWGSADGERVVRARSLLGYNIVSAEEPADFLEAYGRDEGAYCINMLRNLAELFEGIATWERRTDRDWQKHRTPEIGRRDDEQICIRCRAGIEIPIGEGMFSFACPHCMYVPPCPKCSGEIKNGRCIACTHQPMLYVRINSSDSGFALQGVRLACSEVLPTLRWFAVGDKPDLCEEAQLAHHLTGTATMMPDGSVATIIGNANDHLSESEDPALLNLREAAHMFLAGCAIIKRALKLQQEHLQNPRHKVRATAVDLSALKAGAQLVVDAYFTDEKCKSHKAEDSMALLFAANFFNDEPGRMQGFGHSALQFFFVTYHTMPASGRQVAREMIDRLLREQINQLRIVRKGPPLHRQQVARMLLFRSYDKLTRLQDTKASEVDLSLAIELTPTGGKSLHDLRAALKLARGDMAGAKADYEQAVRDAHPDDRHLHSMLYALASIHAVDGNDAAGREQYEHGKKAEARHWHLFGEGRYIEERAEMSALEFAEETAHRRYGTPEEQCERLLRETGKPASQADLERRSRSVMGLPPDQVRRFNEAVGAQTSNFAVGDTVMVHGLQSQSARRHNGALGIIKEGLADSRYTVSVRDRDDPSDSSKSSTVRIKPGNLQRASQSAASHRQAPKAEGRKQHEASEDPLTACTRSFAEMNRKSQRDEELSKSDELRILQARAALAETTDTALNDSEPEGDGDQSFVRESIESDPGRRLKLARVNGMDFGQLCARGSLSPLALACLAGDLEKAQSIIHLASRSGGFAQLTKLLERRESMMRLTPLMCCITGSQNAHTNPQFAERAQHVALARSLLEAGAKPNAKDVGGFTAFHLATNGNVANTASLQIAAMLPQYGGDPNVRNRFGQVPLIEAVMTTRMDVIECLVRAGADPSKEDLSTAALPAKQLKRAGGSITPISLAKSQPAVVTLFSQAELARAKMDPVVFTCSNPGCDKVGVKTCSRCLRSWYCSGECQKADWKDHKPQCKLAATELVRVCIKYDTEACNAVRRSRGAKLASSKPFVFCHPHTVKLQLPMDFGCDCSSVDPVLLGYTRLADRIFEVRSSVNEDAAFQTIVRAIRERGQAGGLKGYFNAWAATECNIKEGTQELDIDARCMKPPQPF